MPREQLSRLQLELLQALSPTKYTKVPLRTYASTILSLADRGYLKLRPAPESGPFTSFSRFLMILTPDGVRALKRVTRGTVRIRKW